MDPTHVARVVERRTVKKTVADSQQTKTHVRIPSFLYALSLPAVLLVGMFFCTPSSAKAGGLSILTDILTMANKLGQQANSLNTGLASQNSYNQQVVAPQANIQQTSSFLNSVQSAYSAAMNASGAASIHSGSLSQTIALENSMLGGAASSISPQYNNVYGNQPKSGTVSTTRAYQSDMADATANEGLALANKSDQFQASVNSYAGSLQKGAANASPGTADMIAAESAAMQLHSQAVQHRLLAALLRQRAIELATKTGQVKQVVASSQVAGK